ncbi:MAG: PQQ-dependent sugar dehydrogenase [Candidatus Marinimicrobia bacterium]|nr:PQQ-dependent sugar dehydrogenase [Candidatus Neomarinimicrobiota bacterium]
MNISIILPALLLPFVTINAQHSNIDTILQIDHIELTLAFPELQFVEPVYLTHVKDSTDRIFVLEKRGRVLVFPNDQDVTEYKVFLDIRDKVDLFESWEKGLLGLVFHPDYVENGFFYLFYTSLIDSTVNTVISRFSVDSLDIDRADSESEFTLLVIPNTSIVHFGGTLQFGEDGYLYISRGDGGADRPTPSAYEGIISEAQNLKSLLGAILRIDVDNPSEELNYGIPADNPLFGNTDGFREELWAWGLRNPWRFSIDNISGEIWVGDVGQNLYEEVNLIEKGNNYGWNIVEGFECFSDPDCDTTKFTPPVFVYDHTGNCAITGGYVYHGSSIPELEGAYIYGDFCSGKIWALTYENGEFQSNILLNDSDISISSFGLDESQELYVTAHFNGHIFKISRGTIDIKRDRIPYPKTFTLFQNYPNPFNPVTVIKYELSELSDVSLVIYNIMGQELFRWDESKVAAGYFEKTWKGINQFGVPVGSGVYLYRLVVGDFVQTKKMLLLK